MTTKQIKLLTPEGAGRAFVFTPPGLGPWPAVIVFMDGPAIRPTLLALGERLASHGYYVLLPDMFWRYGPYEAINFSDFADDDARRAWFAKMMASTDPEKAMRDTGAALYHLSREKQVSGTKVGVTGYCMGAGFALRAAAAFPDQVAAAGSFHGGRLATDAPDSPHLLASKIKAKVLVAGADEDAGFPPEQADRLREALNAAGVDNVVTVYEGARHGYVMPDLPAYDANAAERHWRELLALFDETLKEKAAA